MYSDDGAEYDYAVVGGVRRHICSEVCVGEYFLSFSLLYICECI